MSCTDTCVSMDAECGNEFYSDSLPRARKPHTCGECGEGIPVGVFYERANGKSDGEIWTQATCMLCKEIRETFCCGSWVFTLLWESITEQMFHDWRRDDLKIIDCLARLEHEDARAKLYGRYVIFLGDHDYD